MSQGLKNTIRACAFLLLFAFLLLKVQQIVKPNRDWPSTAYRMNKSFSGLISEDKDTMDVFWVGTSHVYCGVSPMEIYRNSGIRSHLISGSSERIVPVYYLVKEAFKTQSPKIVAVDASSFTYSKEDNIDPFRWQQTIDPLPMTSMDTRIEMIAEYEKLHGERFGDDAISRAILPILYYHTNYLLTEEEYYNIHPEQVYHLKGYYSAEETEPTEAKTIPIAEKALIDGYEDESEAEAVINYNRENIEKLLELCKQHGSEMIIFKVPACTTNKYRGYWSATKHRLFQEIADELNITFLDLNYEDLGIDWQTDTKDGGRHLNALGAKKVSSFLADWLRENRDLDGAQDDKSAAQWDAQLELYDWEMKYSWLRLETEPDKYFEKLKGENYTLLAATSGKVGDWWTEDLQKSFSELTGCQLDLKNAENAAFAVVSRDGSVIEEKNKDNLVNLSGALEDETTYFIRSTADKSHAYIMVDDRQMNKKNPEGILLIVYDNELHSVVDCANIRPDSNEDGVICNHYEKGYRKTYRLKDMEYIYKAMASI